MRKLLIQPANSPASTPPSQVGRRQYRAHARINTLKIPSRVASVPITRFHLPCASCLAALLALIGGCALTPTAVATADDQPRASKAIASAPASPTEQTQYHILAGELAAGR